MERYPKIPSQDNDIQPMDDVRQREGVPNAQPPIDQTFTDTWNRPSTSMAEVHSDAATFGDITWGETSNQYSIKNLATRIKRLEGRGGFVRKGSTLLKVNQTYAPTAQPLSVQQNTAAGTSLYYWSAVGKTAQKQSFSLAQLTKQSNVVQVDSGAKVILSNAPSANGVTSGPSTTSTSPVVIPDMTLTMLTRGYKVQIAFSARITCTLTTTQTANVQIYRDGIAIGPILSKNDTVNGVNGDEPFNVSFIDTTASPAVHTYDIRWNLTTGGTMLAVGTNRTLQVVELG